MGVLSALPLIAAGNLCCCLWVVGGGLVAAYVFQQNQAAPITPGDGALVGLLAGLIGAVVQVLLSIPISIMIGPMEREVMQRLIEMVGTLPPEMRDTLERYGRGEQSGVLLIVSRIVAFMFWLFIGAIFSTLGGLLGSAIFRKQTPPGVIDVPPTS
ncbi:MAG: hypothetical protein AUH43_22470 [Acidobacteria bacterium 13_1_40CM_65_14]|jgi:hypothetical protein|nr:MAG: hypothetical protein AUH43_22470 [Acidobacteria bacterium 13_1_40CM_65_14]OLC82192.1 MAG: hypothetical protein AUH72_07610 [Acidobacteria bacterium 13_1_40CM_4_65_8]